MDSKFLKLFGMGLILYGSTCLAGFPPTTSKDSTDTSPVTTFNFRFPNFTGTHSGTTFSLGVNSISGGGTGQTTANAALNALLPSQATFSGSFLTTNGTDSSWAAIGTMPSASSASLVSTTSASTTFVNALTASITVTAASAPVLAKCVLDMTSATAASVATVRVTVNGVSGGSVTESLTTATTQHLTVPNQALSTALGPGTYTVNCDFNRASGTGTVTVGQGSLTAVALQGTSTNGITQLTGALQAGPGSGSQALTGVLPVANGGTHLSSTTINQILYSSAANVIAGLTTANTGALVTSSTGVPSIVAGTTANRLLRTNGTTVSFAQAALTTDVSGVLPVANGGSGLSAAFAAGRMMYSNGSTLAADSLLTYDAANNRLTIGNGGTSRLNAVVQTTDVQPNDTALNVFSRSTTKAAMNLQNENTLPTLDMTNSGATTIGANIFAEASRGTLAARTQSLSGDTLFSLTAHGRTTTAFSAGLGATLSIVAAEDVTDTTNGSDMILSTTLNGAAAPTERVRITNDGLAKFAMGTMLDTSAAQPTCDVAHRGLQWLIDGAAGVADVFQICQKTALDTYIWTTH